ncbi:putative RNA-directed DNA polymerase from transposon X-element [Trichonephila clavata]|uniref:Putative RNA-directed DNA polymerase from transposon X-element n=1 Tax=Trichonephila clavata TaxID=2740835 RepID=A0A8X6EZE7_TRICU|nr:putative RNA-directed DNA polymerase from transposon X-element [Trichonephila clavata]
MEILSKLKHSFYVDNCVSGVFTEQEVGNFIPSAKAVLSKGCFNLKNWESNANGPGVSKCTGDTDLLGIIWNLDRHTLRCSVINEIPHNKGNTTKRTILSFVQQFYDPIGILSATTLLPKIWLQEAWKIKLAWEDPLSPEMYNMFSRWLLEVACLSKIEIPRYIDVSGKSELHVFVDASTNAYAACIFVRSVTNNGEQVHLIRAKTRVAPIKTISIPRSAEVTDLDLNDFAKFQRRVRFRVKLFKDLKSIFRKEYLGLLAQKRSKPISHKMKVGEIVLVENPNKKRLYIGLYLKC